MTSMGFENVKLFDVAQLRKIAASHIRIFLARVRGGKDAEGQSFPKYSKAYAHYKSQRMTGEKGQRLKRYRGKPIASTNIGNPDFTLTGLTLRGLRIKAVDTKSYTMGWDGEPAEIVQGNAARHRDIMGVPDGEVMQVVNLLGDAIDKELKEKLKDVTIHVKV